MSRLYEALQRSQGADAPAGEKPPDPSRRWNVDEAAPPAAEHLPPPPAAPPTVRPEAPARHAVPRWLMVATPAAALALYVLVHAAGGFGDRGPMRLTGVVAANEVVVAAKTAGRIERLTVQEGSWVKAGDLIARLDREELDAEQRHQVALIGQLSAKLKQTREVVTLEADRGRGRVASAKAQLQVARSQHGEAAASLDQLRKDAERARSLFESGLLSRQEVERVQTGVRVSEARLKSLTDQVAGSESDLDLARANERQADVARSDVDQTQAQIEQARAELAQVGARVGYTSVHAPLPGMVSVRVAREGEVVRLGDPIVTIIDLDDVWVRADVEESYVGRVVVGQSLSIELPSGERRRGRVTFIEPEAHFATQRDVSRVKRDIRTFGIKVALPNPDGRLHQGMTAYVLLPDPPSGPGSGK